MSIDIRFHSLSYHALWCMQGSPAGPDQWCHTGIQRQEQSEPEGNQKRLSPGYMDTQKVIDVRLCDMPKSHNKIIKIHSNS